MISGTGSYFVRTVIRSLDRIIEWRGKPQVIRCDNSRKYISAVKLTWAAKRGIRLEIIPPGQPQQNAYVERYDRTVRYDWSAHHLFETLEPISWAFHPGEQLRFVIISRNLVGTLMPEIRECAGTNSGQHIIYAVQSTHLIFNCLSKYHNLEALQLEIRGHPERPATSRASDLLSTPTLGRFFKLPSSEVQNDNVDKESPRSRN